MSVGGAKTLEGTVGEQDPVQSGPTPHQPSGLLWAGLVLLYLLKGLQLLLGCGAQTQSSAV